MQTPNATYRIQFQPGFGFAQAADIVSYLSALGITHIYASPIFRPNRGSTHGYDTVDPNILNPELGAMEDWEMLVARLREYGMGLVQDIVPNHMAYAEGNGMLTDILENGSSSEYRNFFDICWDHPDENLNGKVMAPFLGRPYEDCLENGEIRIAYDQGRLAAAYGDLRFPLRIESYPDIAEGIDEMILAERRGGAPIDHLRMEDMLSRWRPGPGDTEGLERLDRLLSRQHFRLCCWKDANERINYRRFFTINGLIALRQEDPQVFEHTHKLLFALADRNIVSGVRIDHVDGLADPAGYLRRLRKRMTDKAYIVVEKILAPEEELPAGWPIEGTTGYDFSYWLNAVFVCRENEDPFTRLYARFSGREDSFEALVYKAKKDILLSSMAGELDNLVRRINNIGRTKSSTEDFSDGTLSPDRLKEALSEVLARFPVYRTYITEEEIHPSDREIVDTALLQAAESHPHLEKELAAVRSLLTDGMNADRSAAVAGGPTTGLDAVRAFQQLSSALMAKGSEDTAFYRYHRLVSLNEVGSEPGRFGCSVAEFHAAIARRAQHWPHAMNGTATHDSKRGDDVRARLNVLSEIPAEWASKLEAWHGFHQSLRKETAHAPVSETKPPDRNTPDSNTELLLYQTLIGTWPIDGELTEEFIDRIKAYMIKAVREAGERTSWIDPNKEYETALLAFVEQILTPAPENEFLPSMELFSRKIAAFGIYNSISQCLVKITAPGIPDLYQGTELPQFALVDPDNRGPVSYDERRDLLETIRKQASDSPAQATDLLAARDHERLKMYVTAKALDARRKYWELFHDGAYLPLDTSGRFRRNVIAFARTLGGQWCIVVVPRLLAGIIGENQAPLGRDVWFDTALRLPSEAPRSWRNLFTGQKITENGEIPVGEIMQHFPLGLLIGKETS